MTFVTVDTCPVCASRDRDLLYPGTAGDHRKAKFDPARYLCTASDYALYYDIFKCRGCSLIYAGIKVPDGALEKVYGDVEDGVYLAEEKGREKTFRSMLKEIARHCPGRGKMFEIGSYTGVYLDLARRDGWEVTGAEFSTWARRVAREKRGLELLSRAEDVPPSGKGMFDAVVMWDVIEHAGCPQELVRKAHELLKPGGVLGLSTIVLDSISARALKHRYPFLMEMHLVYFTSKTLCRLLEDQGFKVVSLRRHRRFVSVMYLLNKVPVLAFLKKAPVLSRALRKVFFKVSVGLRDVYAVKKAAARELS